MRIPALAAAILGGSVPSGVLNGGLGEAVIVRNNTMLISPAAHVPLPSPSQVSSSINISNIQADVMIGMRQTMELLSFFSIQDDKAFKTQMSGIVNQITTVKQMLTVPSQPVAMVNIGFSQSGLVALGIEDNLNDTQFSQGQFADAPSLSEKTDTWIEAFKGTTVHGFFIVTSDDSSLLANQNRSLMTAFGSSIEILYSIQGQTRPGNESGHEHFGYMDGIGQPAVDGFGIPFPGQEVVPRGTLLFGGDQDPFQRPDWTNDSSLAAFRQLQQMVPEFNKFTIDNAANIPGLPQNLASDLTGARMIGRWKSGAPVVLTPLFDDPVLGADPNRNNNFTFESAGFNTSSDQIHCPFSAHIRKNVPRSDLTPIDVTHHIMRSGIPYGPEVTPEEASQNTTMLDRGLLFFAYQSSMSHGFAFLQQAWVNNQNFIFGKSVAPGFDPIIGANNGSARWTMGLDPTAPLGNTTLPKDFVVSRGGEYFFMPSMTALQHILQQP